MAPRAIASATVSFGLVAIPVKLFTATSPDQVHFNMLHPETKGRVKQQYIEPGTGAVVERSTLIKGYEYARDQYVVFSEEELKALEAARSTSLDIVQFVPLESVDLLSVENSYFLGPDKGGDKAYRLLTEAMQRSGKVAIGRYAARGKEQLVLLRPYKNGLLMHQLYYAHEVRAMEDVDTGATFNFSELEHSLAEKLINELSVGKFDPSQFRDSYADRVRAAVDEKVAGRQIHTAQEAPQAQIIDLFEALKRSLKQPTAEAAPAQLPEAAADLTPKGEAAAEAEAADAIAEDEMRPRPVKKAVPRKRSAEKTEKQDKAKVG
jgi:DNA end-binding protein Ku